MLTTVSSPTLNLDYLAARRLLLPVYESASLWLVGCGGTGSWLAPTVVRVARLLGEKFAKDVSVYFVDPDRVELKNVYRQNFCEAEIGRNKADTLAYRFGLAWGVRVTAIPERFHEHQARDARGLQVLIGCVDNGAGRRKIAAELAKSPSNEARLWWLDCGNRQGSGQVLLGCGKKTFDPLGLPGRCAWLPRPDDVHPELLLDEAEPGPGESAPACLSCADMAMQDSQGLVINQAVAATAGDFLVRMLLTQDLTRSATYLDLASGSARSVYITDALFREETA